MQQACRNQLVHILSAHGADHAGLALSRYLAAPYSNTDVFRSARTDLYQAAITAVGRVGPLYTAAFQRWRQSLDVQGDECRAVRATELETTGRLILGLGGENILETGVTLHHTYGVPVIPGAALKGLAAHYCHQVWGQAEAGGQTADPGVYRYGGAYHKLLLGTPDAGGLLEFLDAWILPDSLAQRETLGQDVITPHHGSYYSGAAPTATDFDQPNPVPFLAIRGRFLVALAAHACEPDPSLDGWLDLGFELVCQSLREWGVGAKTSSGYGRLQTP